MQSLFLVTLLTISINSHSAVIQSPHSPSLGQTADPPSPWPFQHIDKSAQLSNSAITSVYMDRFDHVWLGTWDGLDRYDGSSISVYKPDPFLKGTISNNVIRNFLEDGNGNLWIVTHQGIDKYNRSTDAFETYLDSLNDIPFLEYNIRACIGPDSTVWTSLIGKGISRYSARRNTFLPVHFEGIDNQWLTAVVDIGSHGGLLYMIGSDGKLICTLNGRVVYNKQLIRPNQLGYHKFIELNGHYWIAIATGANRVKLFDLLNISVKPEDVAVNGAISSLSENLSHSAIWAGTEAGDIFKITLSDEGYAAQAMNSYFPMFSKDHIKVLSITETKQDLIWVGTDGDGVYKFLTRPKTFYSIHSGRPESGQLSHNIVRSVYEDENGALYIGTRGGGLNIMSPNQLSVSVINSKNGLSNDAVLALNKDHDGNIWIGLDGEGVDMMEAKTGRLFHFPRDFENENDLSFSSVYSICVDAFNDIWLGTSGYGIIHMKVYKTPAGRYGLREYDQLQHSGKAKQISIKSNIVYAIVEEKPNTLWFGTRGGGIYKYNALTKEIEEHIQANAGQKNKLVNNDILSLYIDSQEQLWIGTSGGLSRLYLQSKPYRFAHYTQHEGFPNNTIHGILEDASSDLWISTNHGLVKYSRSKNTFKSFDTNDGLQNNEFADGAVFRSPSSEKLYFGGVDGLDIVYPSKLNILNYFPRLAVTSFHVHNVPVVPGDSHQILQDNIDFVDNISLKYDENFVSFYFTTLDYWNKQKSEYAYFLENFDKGWNYIGQQQSVTLTNIPPGSYRLNLNYANEDGSWNATPRVIQIKVLPPFWKTSWAYAFYVLLALGLQISIVSYILWRQRTKKAMAIEKIEARQLKELNDYKLQFFTNIAHEFRTPLTLILGPVTSLLKKDVNPADKRQLNTIYSNSLRLQKLIEELIQFRKIESGKDHLEIGSVDLVPFTQSIVESFQQHAIEREVHLEFYPEPEALHGLVDAKKVEKILINLISNAIKYNAKGGNVGVSLRENQGKAIFSIKDEGIGIAKENRNKIFESFYQNPSQTIDGNGLAKSTGIGLSLTKSLVSIHRGDIKVDSKLEKGSVFSVTIPISKEYYPDLNGDPDVVLPPLNLSEKVSLEFETDHFGRHPAESVSQTSPHRHSYSLLVVDDNAQITSLLDNILSDQYTIFKASNGRKALAILESERVDLVISDILMPDMDGLTLCKTIKENIHSSHIPVILLTAKIEIEHRIEGLQVGADSYIPKPFHPEHLFIRIEKLLERMDLIRKKFQNFAEIELTHLSTGISEKDDRFFSRIVQSIQDHLDEPEFNADVIGEEVGMSKASLYRKVKTITGLTPHGLIKQYRLKKAADLLKNSEMSVSEVIYETGFNSRSYFYKSFNEMFHCHPKDFSERLDS